MRNLIIIAVLLGATAVFAQEKRDSLFPAASNLTLYQKTIQPFDFTLKLDTTKPKTKKEKDTAKVERELNDAFRDDSIRAGHYKFRALKLNITSIYGGLSFVYEKNKDSTNHTYDFSLRIGFSSFIPIIRFGTHRWAYAVFDALYESKGNRPHGQFYIHALLDKFLTFDFGLKEDPLNIIRLSIMNPERHLPIQPQTLQYVKEKSYTGATANIDRLIRGVHLSLALQIADKEVRPAGNLSFGKTLLFGVAVQNKIFEGAGRLNFKLFDLAAYYKKDSVVSVYTYWRAEKWRLDFWGTGTMDMKSKKVIPEIGVNYNAKVPLLEKTRYTHFQFSGGVRFNPLVWLAGMRVFFDVYRF